ANTDAAELTNAVGFPDPETGGHDARADRGAAIDRVTKSDDLRRDSTEIGDRREAGAQRRRGVCRGAACETQMHVRIDESGKKRLAGEIDDAFARGLVSRGRAHVYDASAVDEHDDAVAIAPRANIEDARADDCGSRALLRCCRRVSRADERTHQR